MAEDQDGLRKDQVRELAPWTKLFGAFKVAIDPKKLLLAAAGIFLMSLGWWVLSAFFFMFRSTPPTLGGNYSSDESGFKALKEDRRAWNLFHELAGEDHSKIDAVDLADDYAEYLEIEKARERVEKTRENPRTLISARDQTATHVTLMLGDAVRLRVRAIKEDIPTIVAAANEKKLRVSDLAFSPDLSVQTLKIKRFAVTAIEEDELRRAREYAENVENEQLREFGNKNAWDKARRLGQVKPGGRLRTLPWFEDRGPNPFLLVTGKEVAPDGSRRVPWERGEFVGWLVSDQIPVLLEPLVKFLQPVLYLFHPDASFWTRVYLLFVIVWMLAVWAVFGGAITRIAAVQIARPTERVGLREAVRFAWSRKKSLISAPLFPIVFLAIITIFLIFFGLIEIFTVFVGDILIAGLGWPIVLLLGLLMAVALVGLVGYPLMYATISAEGSDSFDAISRSYSYVYQAPWNYLWYSAIAVAYGAVLVFFVGFMGSLMVYLGKWGVSQAPGGAWTKREPSYLCVYAPTSFGWRDLLIYDNSKPGRVLNNRGEEVRARVYTEELTWYNHVGAYLVSFWLCLFFLMIVGFGYSYFWTASSIIYLLMRRRVDDTDMDEIYLEDEELDEPAPLPPMPEPEKPAGAPMMVDTPTLRTTGSETATQPTGAGSDSPPDGASKPEGGGGTG